MFSGFTELARTLQQNVAQKGGHISTKAQFFHLLDRCYFIQKI